MKRTALLNAHLSALVARLGHLDEIVLCDAGLPCPPGVDVIDLAVTPGLPRIWDVLLALSSELVIEEAIWAEEAAPGLSARFETALSAWAGAQGSPIRHACLTHDAFKARSGKARAIVRTGEVTPYANLILVSGVAF